MNTSLKCVKDYVNSKYRELKPTEKYKTRWGMVDSKNRLKLHNNSALVVFESPNTVNFKESKVYPAKISECVFRYQRSKSPSDSKTKSLTVDQPEDSHPILPGGAPLPSKRIPPRENKRKKTSDDSTRPTKISKASTASMSASVKDKSKSKTGVKSKPILSSRSKVSTTSLPYSPPRIPPSDKTVPKLRSRTTTSTTEIYR